MNQQIQEADIPQTQQAQIKNSEVSQVRKFSMPPVPNITLLVLFQYLTFNTRRVNNKYFRSADV